MTPNIEKILASAFSLLSKAAARKKIYSLMAIKDGRDDLGHLLRAISESELVQARRLFNSLKGQIDISDQYISTIFEKEVVGILEEYNASLRKVHDKNDISLTQVFTQLQSAEKRVMSFYSKQKKDIKITRPQKYFVCKFCGYINTNEAPEFCPVCGACKSKFFQID